MKIFKLFANCIPVNGIKRSILCDLTREQFIFMPNELFEILTKYKNTSLDIIFQVYGNERDKEIEEYFDFLIKNEFGFYIEENEIENFPELELDFKTPEKINNSIIDFDEFSKHDYMRIFAELETLGCRYLELRFFYTPHKAFLLKLLKSLKGKRFRNVDIYLEYCDKIKDEIVSEDLFLEYPQIGCVNFFSAPFCKSEKISGHSVNFVNDKGVSSSSCGEICIENFSVNISSFMESLHFNNCLNKKISVDSNGNIKNCPSMIHDYGNHAANISLVDIVEREDFRLYWNVKKDEIEVCKVCEFRYICSDCRAFLDNIYHKPLKCKYNPYEASWA